MPKVHRQKLLALAEVTNTSGPSLHDEKTSSRSKRIPKDNPKPGRLVRMQHTDHKAFKTNQTTANQEKIDKLEATGFKERDVPSRVGYTTDRRNSTNEKDPGLPVAAATALVGAAYVLVPSLESTQGALAFRPRDGSDGKAPGPLDPTRIGLDSFNCGPLQVDK
jgi:hypothetical protein